MDGLTPAPVIPLLTAIRACSAHMQLAPRMTPVTACPAQAPNLVMAGMSKDSELLEACVSP